MVNIKKCVINNHIYLPLYYYNRIAGIDLIKKLSLIPKFLNVYPL